MLVDRHANTSILSHCPTWNLPARPYVRGKFSDNLPSHGCKDRASHLACLSKFEKYGHLAIFTTCAASSYLETLGSHTSRNRLAGKISRLIHRHFPNQNPMTMKINCLLPISMSTCLLLAASAANADVLGQWTFNNTSNVAAALQSSNLAPGAFVSSLVINPSHDSAGVGAVPNTVNDGYGFGGNSGQDVMFFIRAEYFNGDPDTDNSGIRPVGRITTWDSTDTTIAGQPISFTVTADAISTLTIDSLEVHKVSGGALIGAFQEAGSTRGTGVTLNPDDQTETLPLDAPVVIQPGQSATFTMYVNSGSLNSGHSLNQMSLNGSVSRNTTIPPVAQWTFDNTGSGTQAQRMPVALGASSVASGLTVTPLNVNASFVDFAGFNNLPGSVNDCYGFGGNSGELLLFIHRANYFNDSPTPDPRPVGGVTTWGEAVNFPGVDTTVPNAPLSFTITTDSLTTATLNSVNIAGVGIGNVYLAGFQEAGATFGLASEASNISAVAPLRSPVVIGPSQSKTFTINLNSGVLNSDHAFNTVSVSGSISTAGNTYAIWAATNAGNQSAGLDFDNDGTANGIEFFMGQTGSGFTPRPSPVNGTIVWPRDLAATVASFKVQISDNLGAWTDVVPPDANLNLSNPSEVRYTLPTGAPRKFSRLVVTP